MINIFKEIWERFKNPLVIIPPKYECHEVSRDTFNIAIGENLMGGEVIEGFRHQDDYILVVKNHE